jgi:methionyl-tRNA formyltransferase
MQPERLRRLEYVERLRSLTPDVCVTAAYGQILSRRLLAVPRLGTVNVHASLLPKYRGSAPVQQALMSGETETGVTTMMTDAGIDTGDILLRRVLPIKDDDNTETLLAELSIIGADLLLETLSRLETGNCPRTPQNHGIATYQPMLTKEDGRVIWHNDALTISNRVRGLWPWPGAFAETRYGTLKIISAKAADRSEAYIMNEPQQYQPGTVVLADPKHGLRVACGADSIIELMEVQPQSGKRMSAAAFLRGHAMVVGESL